jgi:uncharacterized BrkB/YihY/UPF0761 family membrane protein
MASSVDSTVQQFASIWKLHGLPFWQLTRNVLHGIDEDNIIGRACELAFNFQLALFPILLLILSLFGLFANGSSQLQNSLLSHFSAVGCARGGNA